MICNTVGKKLRNYFLCWTFDLTVFDDSCVGQNSVDLLEHLIVDDWWLALPLAHEELSKIDTVVRQCDTGLVMSNPKCTGVTDQSSSYDRSLCESVVCSMQLQDCKPSSISIWNGSKELGDGVTDDRVGADG